MHQAGPEIAVAIAEYVNAMVYELNSHLLNFCRGREILNAIATCENSHKFVSLVFISIIIINKFVYSTIDRVQCLRVAQCKISNFF